MICLIFCPKSYIIIAKGLDSLKTKILDMLKTSDGYVSGEKISSALDISRTAVWKHIKNLRKDGYIIQSVTNKGYKLVSSPDILDADTIKSKLSTEFIGRNIIIFDETDSTNAQAKKDSSAPEGTVFIAEVQKSGRGRLGRSWESPRGAGIWHSILLKPDIPLADVSQITLAAGLAVCRALGDGAKIKWPNDIVIGTKKVCGILTEMSAETDRINYVVCGIGINVNTESFPADIAEKATSLRIEYGHMFDRCEIIARFLNEFEDIYKTFSAHGLSAILDEYKANCITLGREVRVIMHNESVCGTAHGIAPDGSLIIRTENGDISVSSGEVSVRGIYGYI